MGSKYVASLFCPRGHLVSGENLYVYQDHRYCKECRRRAKEDYTERELAKFREEQALAAEAQRAQIATQRQAQAVGR